MKQYIGVKLLHAEPMTRGEFTTLRQQPVNTGEENEDGYLVKYTDDYTSWSPAEPFEEAYQETKPDFYEFDIDRNKEYEPHQQRVVSEFDELFEKASALGMFCGSKIFDSLPDDEQLRLGKQLRCMVMYRDVLYERIQNF